MSRPRRPFANPPGRLPATMIKVLAAELSDQGRLSRGKQYWADNAVTDIVIGHGAVTAEIQGSRREPYVVTLFAQPGTGVPAKRDLTIRCTCPDDGMYDACKHAVAAMFALSDEIAVEPELIERWRGGSATPRAHAPGVATDDDGDDHDDQRGDGLAQVVPIRRNSSTAYEQPERIATSVVDPTVQQIASMLVAPLGAPSPTLPDVEPLVHAPVRDRQLADLLADALDHLEVSWE